MTLDFISGAIEVTEKEKIMRNMTSGSKKLVAGLGAVLIAGSVLGGVATSAQAAAKPDAAALQYMVAEEKLAHDVYVTLGDEYGLRVFTNIARSETQHQSAVARLLDKYGIKNPTLGDKVGVFDDPKLQKLYDDLVAKGMLSLQDALEVGVLVEETDIADLKEVIAGNEPAAVDRVLTNLLNASYKHLAAFERQLN
ncbi:MAG: DUF2202 domain-containing protein [Candidatus Nanopelagicales bacterium]|jgi:hypothetical protein|nr:DUF2202 domain-containing protein [Actinomycetes bacterium]MCH9840981.1 DUF2202 domain-containing protein [Actinomycetes bacterium]